MGPLSCPVEGLPTLHLGLRTCEACRRTTSWLTDTASQVWTWHVAHTSTGYLFAKFFCRCCCCLFSLLLLCNKNTEGVYSSSPISSTRISKSTHTGMNKYFSNIICNQYGKRSLILFVFQEHVKTLKETTMWRKVAKWSTGNAEHQKTKLLE